MEWNVFDADKLQLKEYMEKLNINEIMASVLLNRGVDYETAEVLLSKPLEATQDPWLLVNVEQAAKEIIEAVQNNAEIWVFADYDVDGITSGFVMTDFLRKTTNNDVYVYYPDRVNGYAINMDFCKTLVKRKAEEGIEHMLVITVDNGTTCVDEVKYLKENGIEIVVTDHHQPKETLPDCTVVNPHIVEDKTYHHLCGCSTAFKVVQVIEDMVNNSGEDLTSQYLFAVAFGTVADMMPMTPENIAMVRMGLEQVNSKECPKALKHFKSYIGKKKLNPSDIGWEVGPRLNACGRMGDIDKGAMLLFMDDEDNKSDIMDVIIEIEELNEERKSLTKKAEKELAKLDFDNDYVCIFDATGYPAGISGIIAGRMAERYKKVSLVMSGDEVLVGSARCPQGFNLQTLLSDQVEKGNLLGFGGHEQAAGFTVHVDKIEDLRASLNEELAVIYEEVLNNSGEASDPALDIDCEIDLDCLNRLVYESINELPYDKQQFPNPVFSIPNLEVVKWKASRNNENNICLTVKDINGRQKDIWAWKMGETYKELGEPKFIDLAGKVDQNFMNKSQYTLNVLDIRSAVQEEKRAS
ncbi:single-stranded-DNA-specific exonuclease RecJ [Bacillus atrophaeus]|uniref:single-stranded-DNA-specific exonuclease RecJ n=1 Tax=Bacillus atrophaeus TaxID=1452 RepID=UPI002E1D068A|nr:DHH family phosphoesterase [Bacillus atrophaeus]